MCRINNDGGCIIEYHGFPHRSSNSSLSVTLTFQLGAHIFRNEYDTIWTISSIINIQKKKNVWVDLKLIQTIAIKELLVFFICDSRVIFFFSVKYHW